MNLKQKLVLLLSDPEISDAEFRSVKTGLESGEFRKLLKDAELIRSALREYQTHPENRNRRATQSDDESFVAEINDLLRKGAGMTARDGLEALIVRSDYKGHLPDRISFADGVMRMGNEVGRSRLLNAAHQIRNQLGQNNSGLAWPLNRE